MRMPRTVAVFLAIAVLAGAVFAAPVVEDQWEEVERKPGEGEVCIVCDMPIATDETAVRIRHKGRTVHVNEKLLDEWRADPGRYFSKVQARSTLFDEESVVAQDVERVWWTVGVYAVAGLIIGAACAYVAVHRGRCAKWWFIWGLIANVVALAALFALERKEIIDAPEGVPRGLRKVPKTRRPKPCPSCGSANHPSATSCLACGAAVEASVDAEVAQIGRDS